MILPTGAANFTEAMRIGAEVYHNLKSVIKKKYGQDGKNKFEFFFYHNRLFHFLIIQEEWTNFSSGVPI